MFTQANNLYDMKELQTQLQGIITNQEDMKKQISDIQQWRNVVNVELNKHDEEIRANDEKAQLLTTTLESVNLKVNDIKMEDTKKNLLTIIATSLFLALIIIIVIESISPN